VSNDILDQFGDAYDAIKGEMGRFNLAIFGETGAGKSTLINAMFGLDIAQTGIGRPVTQETSFYEHPNGNLGVYDTKGTETGHSETTIVEQFRGIVEDSWTKPLEEQIHVVWFCVKADDLRIDDVQDALIRDLADMKLPVMLVITKAFPTTTGEPHPDHLELVQSAKGRKMPIAPDGEVFLVLAKGDEHRGAEAHGLETLLDATFRVAPEGVEAALCAAQQIDLTRKTKAAQRYVVLGAAAAATTCASPVPFSQAALIVPVQIAMMAQISAAFGLSVEKRALASVAGAAFAATGVTQAGRYIVGSLLKFVPVVGTAAGTAIEATVAASLTGAVGAAWIAVCTFLYKMDPAAVEALDKSVVTDLFKTEFKNATQREARTGSSDSPPA
jgi:uncharacterized protein (DUF697 family)